MSDDALLLKPPIEGLVETCIEGHRKGTPDRETEIVVADWCEEHGLLGIAGAVRQDEVNLRWSALAHLWRAIDQTFWVSRPTTPAISTPYRGEPARLPKKKSRSRR